MLSFRFAHVPFDFISLYLFLLTIAIKLKDTNYKSHWNILVLCGQQKKMSDKFWFWKSLKCFNIFFDKKNRWRQIWTCPIEKWWFPFISIVWFHFIHKTEKFWFWKLLKHFNIFSSKKMMSDLTMSCQTVCDLV